MQYATWNATQQAAATDDAMIGFIRGQTGYEDEDANDVVITPDPQPLYRT